MGAQQGENQPLSPGFGGRKIISSGEGQIFVIEGYGLRSHSIDMGIEEKCGVTSGSGLRANKHP